MLAEARTGAGPGAGPPDDLGYLEVQSLSMLATLAGDERRPSEHGGAGEQAVAVAARRGRHPSAWSAGPMGMLAYADLLAGDPAAAAARCEEALGAWDTAPAGGRVHAARGPRRRPRRPGQPPGRARRDARGARGVRRHAGAAVDARRAGRPRAPGRAAERQHAGRRGGRRTGWPPGSATGETLLLQAWTEAADGPARGRPGDRRAGARAGHADPAAAHRGRGPSARGRGSAAGGRRPAGRRGAGRGAGARPRRWASARPFALAGPCTQSC